MEKELAKSILRSLVTVAGLSMPPLALALLANQIVALFVHYQRNGRLDGKVVRRILLAQGVPIPLRRALLLTMLPLLSLQVATLRQAIDLSRRAAGSALPARVVEAFLSIWQALRGAYEDALADTRAPGEPPRQHYPGTRRVVVQQGDSLSSITLREWDDALLWPLLYDANQATIGRDHNLIHAGMPLVLPDIAGLPPSEIDRARQRGRDWR